MAEKDYQLNKEQYEFAKERNRLKKKFVHNEEKLAKKMEQKFKEEKYAMEVCLS